MSVTKKVKAEIKSYEKINKEVLKLQKTINTNQDKVTSLKRKMKEGVTNLYFKTSDEMRYYKPIYKYGNDSVTCLRVCNKSNTELRGGVIFNQQYINYYNMGISSLFNYKIITNEEFYRVFTEVSNLMHKRAMGELFVPDGENR